MNLQSLCRFAGLATLLSALGCAAHGPAAETAGAAQTATIKGSLKGGQQPVSGASVQLYAAGSGGDGSASSPLLATPALTDSNGNFNFQYSCPAGNAELYLVASGGNPGLAGSATNAALTAASALGTCAQLSATSFINVNEVTTVAAIAALAPFASGVTAIGSSASDLASLQAAFATAAAFASVPSGSSPGANIPSGFAVPSTKINTLADVVATCVNSAGGTAGDGSPCGNFFSLTTLPGGTAPTTTTAALLNLAASPTLNTASLYALASPSAPFQPQLQQAPPDFAIYLIPLNQNSAYLQISPAAGLVFPATQVATSAAVQQLTLSNTGSSALTISNIAISGTNAADYSLFSNCVAALAAQSSCTVSITFSPNGDGASTAYLIVTSNAGNSPAQVSLSGSGTGTAPTTGNPTTAATAAGAYVFNGSTWVPVTTTSTADILPYVPPSLDLYCLNTTLSQWVGCPSISTSGTSPTIASVTTLLKGNGAGSAIAATAQDVANAITFPANTSQYLTNTIPVNPGSANLVMGYNAGGNLYTGSGADAANGGQANVVLGYNAGANMTTARESVYIGSNAGLNITGNGSGPDDMIEVLIGSLAGAHLTNLGGASVMIGQKAGALEVSSADDVLIGVHGGTALLSSSTTTAVGGNVLNGGTLVTAENSVAIGSNAMTGATGDINGNTAVGAYGMFSIGGGQYNTSVGFSGMVNLTSGSENTQLGSQLSNIGSTGPLTGNYNLLLGFNTGNVLTSGSNNVLENSGAPLTSGNQNVIVGGNTAGGLNSGSYNVVVGYAAGQNIPNVSNDVLIGYAAGLSSQSNNLVAIGDYAGFFDTTGARSTFVGYEAGHNVVTGTDNTAVGDNALSLLSGSESGNVGVGSAAQVAAGVGNAVQLGTGTNALANSLQFQASTVMDGSGYIHSSLSTPATSTDACVAGAIWADASYVYVCVATNTIERAALSSFGGSGTPTATPGPFAATGATATVTGSDTSGVVTVQVGTGLMASGNLVAINFSHTFPSAPNGCTLSPRNAATAGDQSQFFPTAPSTTGWTITPVPGATLFSGVTLQWSYYCN